MTNHKTAAMQAKNDCNNYFVIRMVSDLIAGAMFGEMSYGRGTSASAQCCINQTNVFQELDKI